MGYVGKAANSERIGGIILSGLARQEYRGYDSAGIALHCGDEIKSVKMVGRVSELAKRVAETLDGAIPAQSGIGHTRWATHGGVTETNAHPHESCDGMVTLLHNGIIENAREIRARLEAQGVVFITETDTESPCQLLAHIYRGDPLAAMCELTRSLEGAFALVILFRDRPGEIWCARKGSPLVVAHEDGASYCASDPTALLDYTHDLYFLDEGEMAMLRPEGATFYTFDGKQREKRSIRLNWDSVMADKGQFDHFMRKEIDEQPDVLRLTIDAHATVSGVEMDSGFALPKNLIKKISRVHFVACGTSYFATLVARDIMESLDPDLDTRVDVASEYRYRNVHGGPDTLAVFVSQSGETADTLAAARIAKAKGTHCVAITNVRGSTIDREVANTLLSLAGPEIGVAATKTFMAQIALLTLLVLHLLKERGTLRAADETRLIGGMRALPAQVQTALDREPEIKAIAEKYKDSSGYFFIGRRESVPLTMEGALKLKEIAYCPSEAYAAGEMKHGPIAMLDEKLTVVAVVPDNDLREKTLSNVEECRARRAPIIVLANDGDGGVRDYANDVIFMPRTERELMPLVGVVPLQLFAYHTARALGRDIDMPRNLAKSVTVE
jgi:glucosamine--fructose-6-phosphate aminotransferase (isomerizing)